MFEKYFKSVIMSSLGEFIEDFTYNDLTIDNWNGRVEKTNIVLKKTALMRLSKLVGLPVDVVDGNAKVLRISIPWSKLWKEPIEILIEDVYACCHVKDQYSEEFAEEMLLQYKESTVRKILDEIKTSEEEKEDEAKSGLLYGYVKTILDNIKIKMTNIHLKIEDIGVSIKDQAFSFGLNCDLIEYGYVTKKPELKAGAKPDNKPKLVPRLVMNGLSLYWTTMDNYIIRPLNIKWMDTSVTISPLIISCDISILNNLKCLMNLINYH